MPRTAVVTGSNKGIGLEIARLLGERGAASTVVVTSRDAGRAADAARALAARVPSTTYLSRPLDLTDAASVSSFIAWAADPAGPLAGRLDVLVSNAGLAYKGDTWGVEEAKRTLACNYVGTRDLAAGLLGCMPPTPASRIVNVGSRSGQLRIISSPALRARWEGAASPASGGGPAAIDALVAEFVASVADGTTAQKGWPRSMYGVSKLAEATYTRWLAAGVDVGGGHGPAVALACPGGCATDMSSGRGRPAAEGADTPAWLASATESEAAAVHGEFWADRARVEF